MMTKAKMWRFIDTGIGSAGWNMALDEALLNGFKEGDMPILRLYGWKPALSLGRFSGISRSVDVRRVEHEGLPCIRRMTGGGVLVHGGDLSYTLIVPRESLKEKGVKKSYRYLCGFLIRLYEKLGQNAHFAHDLGLDGGSSDICLAGNEAYDIIIEGKKMGGNAQRYTRHALFQHGTVPMRLDEAFFNPLFLVDSGLERAATLQRLGCTVTYEKLAGLLRETFRETYDADLVAGTLHPSEEERAGELLACKYSQKRWNLYAKQDCA